MQMKPRTLILLFTLWTPAPLAGQTQTLTFPRFATRAGGSAALDTSEYTGFAIANLETSASATLTFTAYDTTGSLVAGAGITNPATRTLAAGAQLPIVDFQIFGSPITAKGPIGWIKVDSSVQKVVGFFLAFNGSLTVLDGADTWSAGVTSFVLPEVEETGFTQVHVVNPNAESATVSLQLYRSDGLELAAASRTINANGAVAETVAELFPGVVASRSDYIRATSNRAVAAFEYLGKSRVYVHGVNGQSTTAGATTLYCPQYVVGGSDYMSLLSVVNLDSTAGTVALDFVKDDGTVIASKTASIDAKGKLYIGSQTFFVPASSALTQGYLRITSSGPKLAGSVVFGDPAKAKFSTALALVASLQSSVIFSHLASNSEYFTGVALLNPNTSAVSATVEVRDDKGALVGSRTATIGAGERKSQLLTQLVPALAGQSRSAGYFKVTTDKPIASFALFGTNDLSVLSAVPPQVVPSAPPVSYDGTWTGLTSTERTVEMVVASNGITRFKMGFVFTDGANKCTASVSIPYTTPRRITNGAFSFTFNGPGLTTAIDGTFASAKAVSGTFGPVFLSNFRCAAHIVNGTAPGGTFTMSK